MYKLLTTMLLAAAIHATCQEITETKKEAPFFFKAGMPLDDQNNMPQGQMEYGPRYNTQAGMGGITSSEWDVNVRAAFTYWHASQDAMDLAYVAPVAGGNTGLVTNQIFGYKPGFIVGIGVDSPFDGWVFNAEYTWYNHEQQGSYVSTGGNYTQSDWFSSPVLTLDNQLSSSWNLNFNQLDLEGGRPHYEGRALILYPTAGLRMLWIKQTLDFAMTSSAPGIAASQFSGYSSMWGIGPKVDLNSHWIVYCNLRLEAAVGSSLLYTKNTTVRVNQSIQKDLSAFKPTMDMGLGFGYLIRVSDALFMDVSARYDFMQFWSQNILRNFASTLSGDARGLGDLCMHGLTFNVRCDF